MKNPTLGLFGDSYIVVAPNKKNWSGRFGDHYDIRPWGKYGSNLYHAIDCWHTAKSLLEPDHFDYVIFTLTWHTRLYSVNKDRNNYLCHPDSTMWRQGFRDPEIQTDEDFEKFQTAVRDYHRYVYDDSWARFRHELEIKYLMDLPEHNPHTRFVFMPNTALSRQLALRHHRHGVLLDFAFEDVSNQDPTSPGKMPISQDHRFNHISPGSHDVIYHLMKDILTNYTNYQDRIIPIDMAKFNVDL